MISFYEYDKKTQLFEVGVAIATCIAFHVPKASAPGICKDS